MRAKERTSLANYTATSAAVRIIVSCDSSDVGSGRGSAGADRFPHLRCCGFNTTAHETPLPSRCPFWAYWGAKLLRRPGILFTRDVRADSQHRCSLPASSHPVLPWLEKKSRQNLLRSTHTSELRSEGAKLRPLARLLCQPIPHPRSSASARSSLISSAPTRRLVELCHHGDRGTDRLLGCSKKGVD